MSLSCRDANCPIEMQFVWFFMRKDGLKAGRGASPGIQAEFPSQICSGDRIKYLHKNKAGDKTADMCPECDTPYVTGSKAGRE